MDETFFNTIEEDIETLPDEVRDFIFGDDYKAIKKELLDVIPVEEEKLGLSNMLMFFLLGKKTIQELNDYIGTLSISDDKKRFIGNNIQEKIIDNILTTIEVYQDKDDKKDTGLGEGAKKSSTSNLTSLADRLKQATIVTPGGKTYSSTPSASSETKSSIPTTIDPYHEPIDN